MKRNIQNNETVGIFIIQNADMYSYQIHINFNREILVHGQSETLIELINRNCVRK